jgi:hypothetical protein
MNLLFAESKPSLPILLVICIRCTAYLLHKAVEVS